MPARYREVLTDMCEGQVIVTLDRDGCLLIYPKPEWLKIEKKIANLPSFNDWAQDIKRLYIGHATECELDNQGRVLLPQLLRERANLDKRAILVGQVSKFELWNEDTWNAGTTRRIHDKQEGKLTPPPEWGLISI